jgi:hypothetical protein
MGPSWINIILIAGGKRAVPGTVKIDHPQVGKVAVCHDVLKVPYVNDTGTIRGYLGIRNIFHIKDIEKFQTG